jgi:hypothetical protein
MFDSLPKALGKAKADVEDVVSVVMYNGENGFRCWDEDEDENGDVTVEWERLRSRTVRNNIHFVPGWLESVEGLDEEDDGDGDESIETDLEVIRKKAEYTQAENEDRNRG